MSQAARHQVHFADLYQASVTGILGLTVPATTTVVVVVVATMTAAVEAMMIVTVTLVVVTGTGK